MASQVILAPTSPAQSPFPHDIYFTQPQPSATLYRMLGTGSTRHRAKPVKVIFSATTNIILLPKQGIIFSLQIV